MNSRDSPEVNDLGLDIWMAWENTVTYSVSVCGYFGVF